MFGDIDGTSHLSVNLNLHVTGCILKLFYSEISYFSLDSSAHIHILTQPSEPLLPCFVLPAPPPHCALSSPRSTAYLQCSIRRGCPTRLWLAEGSTFCALRLPIKRASCLDSVLQIRSIAPRGSEEPILCSPQTAFRCSEQIPELHESSEITMRLCAQAST